MKAKEAADSVRHPFWMKAVGVKPGEQNAGAVTAGAEQAAAGREQRGHLSASRATHRTHPPEAPDRRAPPKELLHFSNTAS